MHRPRLIGPLAIAVLLLGLAIPASAMARARLHGPRGVSPGHHAVFTATGLRRRQLITGMFVTPIVNAGGNGVGQFIKHRTHADRHGRARLDVVWPRYYLLCGGQSHCRHHGWGHRQRVDVVLMRSTAPWPHVTVRVQLIRWATGRRAR